MVIYCPPQISTNSSFSTVEAVSALGKTVRYENDFMILQQAKRGLFSKPSGLNYRVILIKTEAFLDQRSTFSGKKIIVAESDDWSEILSDWTKLESYLLPMVMVIAKKETGMSQVELEDILNSITQKKTFKQGLKSIGSKTAKTKKKLTINGLAVNESSLDNDLEYVSNESPNVDEEDDDDNKELDSVNSYEDAVVAIEEFIKVTMNTQKLLDNFGKKASSQQRMTNDILKHTKRLKDLQKMLDSYFKTVTKNSITDKILRQYNEEKPKFTKILNNASYKKIISENTKDIYEKKKPSTSSDLNDNFEVDGGQQQQVQVQQQKEKFVLSQWDKNTIDVETAIAKETHEDLKRLETDYTELHGMYQDMHSIIIENQETLDSMLENVETANNHIDKGIDSVKKAKKLTRFGLF
ncbi:syntaxin [Naegleria gruberi]|uniref:Syntaxin n=1 Tax=Naegleria gruberi TaxID=5762 RepID=D2V207_NAEGR|nr:syntaxin [Naegleria gruberi]EFC49404.1 syntaxin [Naegleria gruberi]|eukprot:XP_002682148.1 syntaxin [Naegleria gruberi]